MAIQMECCKCHRKMSIGREKCPCGADMVAMRKLKPSKANRKAVRYWVTVRRNGKRVRLSPRAYKLDPCSITDGRKLPACFVTGTILSPVGGQC